MLKASGLRPRRHEAVREIVPRQDDGRRGQQNSMVPRPRARASLFLHGSFANFKELHGHFAVTSQELHTNFATTSRELHTNFTNFTSLHNH